MLLKQILDSEAEARDKIEVQEALKRYFREKSSQTTADRDAVIKCNHAINIYADTLAFISNQLALTQETIAQLELERSGLQQMQRNYESDFENHSQLQDWVNEAAELSREIQNFAHKDNVSQQDLIDLSKRVYSKISLVSRTYQFVKNLPENANYLEETINSLNQLENEISDLNARIVKFDREITELNNSNLPAAKKKLQGIAGERKAARNVRTIKRFKRAKSILKFLWGLKKVTQVGLIMAVTGVDDYIFKSQWMRWKQLLNSVTPRKLHINHTPMPAETPALMQSLVTRL